MRLFAALLIWSIGFGVCAVWLRTFWRNPAGAPRAVLAAPALISTAMILAIVAAVLDGASPVGTWVRALNLLLTVSLLLTGTALLVRRSRLQSA